MKRTGALEKAFAILAELSRAPERWRPLGDLADAAGVHRATAAHALRKLVALHYAEQDGPRGGYRLGPMPHFLTRHGSYRRDLVAAAQPHMARLTRETGGVAVLAALVHGRRLTLCRIEGGGALRVHESVELGDNVYATPTGRLLLAHATPDEVELVLAENGLPGDAWPEARDRAGLSRAVAAVRRRGGCLVVMRPEIGAAACGVHEGGRTSAALGVYLPAFRFRGRNRTHILSRLRDAAEAITSDLEQTTKGPDA